LASTAKAERLLGFRAAIPLEEGLRGLVDWWQVERHRFPASAGLRAVAS
jgi:UDP-glucose 4-epimerase